ncbi:MAG: flagellar biosynthetic protein FliO [Burkholderiales bacterium RIFCSPHIGHO2_12_FULL_61_11]|nr:MAG: flagellar biosynthetic protein FliO [Burkholderiales bacterium RIFCSPHIGHO2_12_FULL_61_11]
MRRPRISRVAAALLASLSFSASAVLPTVPAAAAEPVRSFGASGLLQAALGLALVVALIFLCGWAVRRFGLQASGRGRLLKVVSSVMVGQRERVVVVEIGDAWLVLGVGAGQVRALHTLPAKSLPQAQAAPALHGLPGSSAFSHKLRDSLNHLNQLRKRE